MATTTTSSAVTTSTSSTGDEGGAACASVPSGAVALLCDDPGTIISWAADTERLYFGHLDAPYVLQSLSKLGGAPSTLADGWIYGLTSGDVIYQPDDMGPSALPKDGAEPTVWMDDWLFGFTSEDAAVFYGLLQSRGRLYGRSSLTSPAVLLADVSDPKAAFRDAALATDASSIYWALGKKIEGAWTIDVRRVAKDGSGAEVIASWPIADFDHMVMTSDADALYVSVAKGCSIRRVEKASGEQSLLVPNEQDGPNCFALAVDDERLYFARDAQLLSMPKDGSAPPTLLADADVQWVTVDDAYVYAETFHSIFKLPK